MHEWNCLYYTYILVTQTYLYIFFAQFFHTAVCKFKLLLILIKLIWLINKLLWTRKVKTMHSLLLSVEPDCEPINSLFNIYLHWCMYHFSTDQLIYCEYNFYLWATVRYIIIYNIIYVYQNILLIYLFF